MKPNFNKTGHIALRVFILIVKTKMHAHDHNKALFVVALFDPRSRYLLFQVFCIPASNFKTLY